MANCKQCGHPSWCHHLVSGKCGCMTFHDVTRIKGGYEYNTKACGCIMHYEQTKQ